MKETKEMSSYDFLKIILVEKTSPDSWAGAPRQLVELPIPEIVDKFVKIISKDNKPKLTETSVMSDLILALIIDGISKLANEGFKDKLTHLTNLLKNLEKEKK